MMLRNLVAFTVLATPGHSLSSIYPALDTSRFVSSSLPFFRRELLSNSGFSFSPIRLSGRENLITCIKCAMSGNSLETDSPEIQHIGYDEMEEIIEDYENGGREDSEYCVIDVRTDEEVMATGKLSPKVFTLPVQVIMEYNVFGLDADDFEEICGFEKPTPDETIVFTCKAGIRSVYACQFAAKAGYSKLVNYVGGSTEWFSRN
jgi:rhodanese-related sulfurtransferase